MLHRIFEEDEIHRSVQLVVATKSICEDLKQRIPRGYGHVLWLSYALRKVAEDQRLLQNFRVRNVIEGLLQDVLLRLVKELNVLDVSQLVSIDSLCLVTPKFAKVHWCLDAVVVSKEHPLENIAEVPQVEDVVELDGSRGELLAALGVEEKCGVDDVGAGLPDEEGELVAGRVLQEANSIDQY